MTTRSTRRARERDDAQLLPQEPARAFAEPVRARGPFLLRAVAFVAVAALIVGGGAYMAASVFMGQRDSTSVSGAIPMRISMAGFDPATIDAKPGQKITLDWWNTDNAMHLENGVHTLVSDALNVRLELPADSRKTVTITAPDKPGDYDFWCDSCCGGKGSPTMHGTLHVAA